MPWLSMPPKAPPSLASRTHRRGGARPWPRFDGISDRLINGSVESPSVEKANQLRGCNGGWLCAGRFWIQVVCGNSVAERGRSLAMRCCVEEDEASNPSDTCPTDQVVENANGREIDGREREQMDKPSLSWRRCKRRENPLEMTAIDRLGRRVGTRGDPALPSCEAFKAQFGCYYCGWIQEEWTVSSQ